MNNPTYQVISLNSGKIETLTYGNRTFESAIRKQPVLEPVYLGKIGLAVDEQAYKGHGGADKALCLYPYDHYPYWRKIVSDYSETALFGENLTVEGLTENNAHIGDTFSFGEAVIQISEPRNPCHKLAAKYDVPDMVIRVRDSGYTGFYLRVLKEGTVKPGDNLVLIEPDPHQVSVSLVNDVTFFDRFNLKKLEKVLQVDALSESYRKDLSKQYEKGRLL